MENENKKVIKLDSTGCKYLGEIHERIRKAFDFSECYRNNWSVFWNLLWTIYLILNSEYKKMK